jgi:hypothetical protein
MSSILSEAASNFENLSVEDLKAHLAKMAEQKAKQREKQTEYNASPEAKEKRKDYQQTRLTNLKADPEKYAALQAKRKEYMNRDDVKAKRTEYHKRRNAEQKALIEAAKKAGIDVKAILSGAAPTPA